MTAMNRDREYQFAQALEEIRKLAREQGMHIADEQVRAAFAAQDLSEEQFAMIYDYLKKHKIGVDETVDPEDYMSAEEKNYLEDYLQGLQGLRKYTEGEKEAALLSAMAGERSGHDRLVEIYLPEVVGIAKLYIDQGVSLEDLIGEGNVILAAGVAMPGCVETAAEAESLLIKMIMEAMEELIDGTARMQESDRKMAEQVNIVAEAARELAEALGRKVTPGELAEESGLSEEVIRDAVRISGGAIEDITK